MTDFLDEKRREITERLHELKPLVDEFNRLEAAAAALAGAVGSAASDAGQAVVHHRRRGHRRRTSSRKRAARATATVATTTAARKAAPKPVKNKAARRAAGRPAKGRASRREGTGTRAAQALSLIQTQPGITIPELAAKMGIATNYLYRVLPGLQKEGKIRKDGRGWRATAS